MNISIVISLFNEEKHISNVLTGIHKYELPVVVVDDGSSDNSKVKVNNLLRSQNSKLKKLTLLEHKINLGKGAAMKTGAEYAFSHGADGVVFMDSDGQHNPEDVIKFVELLSNGKYDVIFGSRNFSYGVPLVRYLGNKFASVLMAFLFGIYVSDVVCGFRAMTKRAFERIKWDSNGYGVETEMVARVGNNKLSYCEVPVETIYYSGVKGVTILDAFGILVQVVKWRLTI
jgi:glycosyltransferase involved in cell wall biosynthesis